jgi:hypothetical protein
VEDGGAGVGGGQGLRAPTICGVASSSISVYWVPRNPGARSKSSALGRALMKGKWWKVTGCASTSNRLCSTS